MRDKDSKSLLRPATQYAKFRRTLPSGYLIAWVVAAIQFTNALEYMALSPLFPWMARDLNVPVSWAGYAAGVYTLTAIVSRFIAHCWVDRFDPRRVLILALSALACVTFAVALLEHFYALMIWRALAGLIGGVAMGSASGVLLRHARVEERPALLLIPVLAPVLVVFSGGTQLVPLLFFAGGVAGLIASKLSGRMVVSMGARRVFVGAMLCFAINLVLPIVHCVSIGLFIIFFMAMTYAALVATSTVSASYPHSEQRASFCVLQTALTHLCSSLAFFMASAMMSGRAIAMLTLWPLLVLSAFIAIGLAFAAPWLMKVMTEQYNGQMNDPI